MQRFILNQNLLRLRRVLSDEISDQRREMFSLMITSMQRELSLLDAASSGLWASPPPPPHAQDACEPATALVDDFAASELPYLLLHPGPGLHIIDINDAFAQATLVTRRAVAGEALFEIFPDNPADEHADGVSNLYASLREAAATGRARAMAVQRYDVRDDKGSFIERYWRPLSTPIFDASGRLTCMLHVAQDVTVEILGASERP
jgi:PAS domain-containing protein